MVTITRKSFIEGQRVVVTMSADTVYLGVIAGGTPEKYLVHFDEDGYNLVEPDRIMSVGNVCHTNSSGQLDRRHLSTVAADFRRQHRH
jgi:hypothetical protein